MTIKCIAIDDEPKALEVINNHVNKIDYLQLLECFTDPYKAISYLDNHAVDLVFLDIQMQDISGVKLARLLKKPPLVIFTTAHSEYAIESYEIEAIDYLLKPFDFTRFLMAVTKAKEWFTNKTALYDDFFFVNVGHQKRRIIYNDILFIQAEGNYVAYMTLTHKVIVRATISETLGSLPNNDFVQIHRSVIVSLKWIDKIEDNQVYIKDYRHQISSTYRDTFFKLINEKRGR